MIIPGSNENTNIPVHLEMGAVVNLRDDKKSIGKCLDSQLGSAFYVGLVFYQSVCQSHLHCPSTRHHTP